MGVRGWSAIWVLVVGVWTATGQVTLPAWRVLETEPYRGKQDDIVFVSPDIGWYGNGSGKVFGTRDGGERWELLWEQPGTFVRCLAFVDEFTGFLGNVGTGYFPGVTDETLVYKTTDAGRTWAALPGAQVQGMGGLCSLEVLRLPYINHGELAQKTRLIGVGRVGGPAWLIMSDDLGQTWSHIDLAEHAGMAFDVHFLDLNTGVVAASSSSDLATTTARVLRTEDAGRTWEVVYDSGRATENIWKFSFPTPLVGYGTVQSYDPGATERFVIKTEDGGRTWRELPLVDDPQVRQFGIGFLDEKRGWVGAVPHAFKTEDGGETWQRAEMGVAVNKIRVLRGGEDPLAYAIGVQVLRTHPPAAPRPDSPALP